MLSIAVIWVHGLATDTGAHDAPSVELDMYDVALLGQVDQYKYIYMCVYIASYSNTALRSGILRAAASFVTFKHWHIADLHQCIYHQTAHAYFCVSCQCDTLYMSI